MDEAGHILVNNMNFMTAVFPPGLHGPGREHARANRCDVNLAAAEKSAANVHTICDGDALPHAVFAPGNPIPTICTFIDC
jgi:hypothetical protein